MLRLKKESQVVLKYIHFICWKREEAPQSGKQSPGLGLKELRAVFLWFFFPALSSVYVSCLSCAFLWSGTVRFNPDSTVLCSSILTNFRELFT